VCIGILCGCIKRLGIKAKTRRRKEILFPSSATVEACVSMKIHGTQELEDLIEAVQPGNGCYKYWSFHNVPKWAKACGL
jgi:hypothetical protein